MKNQAAKKPVNCKTNDCHGTLEEIAKTKVLDIDSVKKSTAFYECSDCKKLHEKRKYDYSSAGYYYEGSTSHYKPYHGRLTKDELIQYAPHARGHIGMKYADKIIKKRSQSNQSQNSRANNTSQSNYQAQGSQSGETT